MKKIIYSQFILLLIATVFAWTNFFREFVDWLNNKPCEAGCTASNELVNPFLTPCFYGAIFFALALVLTLIMMFLARNKKATRQNSGKEEEDEKTEIKEEKENLK